MGCDWLAVDLQSREHRVVTLPVAFREMPDARFAFVADQETGLSIRPCDKEVHASLVPITDGVDVDDLYREIGLLPALLLG